jgi:NAD(P)-dependent dehydrogenase (short-subunit alcohol dehydrogenase family)
MSTPTTKTPNPVAIYPDLKGKVALLTGIGQNGDPNMWGNGAATALTLVQNGVRVFGCDVDLQAAQHTKQRIQQWVSKSRGAEEENADALATEGDSMVEVITADVTDANDVSRLVKACIDRFGRIDILVNNVGKSAPGGPAEMEEDVW